MSNQSGDDYPTLSAILQPILQREHGRVVKNVARAQKQGQAATLTFRQWLIILHAFEWRCAYCRRAYTTMEHVVPISQGGGTTAHNCVPTCEPCNSARNRHKQQDENALAKLIELF